MNRTITISIAAIAGVTAIGAAVASTILGEARIETTDAPGLMDYTINAAHHDAAIEGVVWYPSHNDGRGRIVAENGVFFGVPASRDASFAAPAASEKYPLVVLSHGMGGHQRTMSWLASEIAAKGAIVVAVNHPNSTWGDFDMSVGIQHWTRAQDVSAALDAVMADPMFAEHIDATRVMAAGFSYGGWTALSVGGVTGHLQGSIDHCASAEASSHCSDLTAMGIAFEGQDAEAWDASYADPRVTHVAAADPALTWGLAADSADNAAPNIRMFALGAGGDRLPATDFDASGFAAMVPHAQIDHFAPASHFMFLPECKPNGPAILEAENDDPVCTDPAGSDRGQVHDAIIAAIAADLDI